MASEESSNTSSQPRLNSIADAGSPAWYARPCQFAGSERDVAGSPRASAAGKPISVRVQSSVCMVMAAVEVKMQRLALNDQNGACGTQCTAPASGDGRRRTKLGADESAQISEQSRDEHCHPTERDGITNKFLNRFHEFLSDRLKLCCQQFEREVQ